MEENENEQENQDTRGGREISLDEFFELLTEYTDVPPPFYETESGEPYQTCSKCGCALNGEVEYFVEKHFAGNRTGEVSDKPYFEYALCKSCILGLGIEISEESRTKIRLLIEEVVNTDLFEKTFSMFPGQEDVKTQTTTCFLTCEPIDVSKEYTLYGHFKGDKMVLSSESPRVIGAKGLEMFQQVLSKSTKDEMNKIFDIIDFPPELMEELKFGGPLLV
ncbi:MAG: hypothetical protein KDC76_09835 [Bacteroidetes bacterium]|nr:hypothetical protein [Bacteroidota bacterium]